MTGEERPFTFRHRVRVGYGDTDQGGVVHHAVYLRWLEAARVEYLRARGVDYRAVELDERLGLPVVKVEIAYRKPARFDEELEVATSVGRLSRATLRFDYVVWRGDERLTDAQITLACVRLDAQRLCSIPSAIREACS
jgi:acyl-CoA thioester hydrolase